jgi:hypothetical protein
VEALGEASSHELKASALLFWGNGVAFVTQSKSNHSGAADLSS